MVAAGARIHPSSMAHVGAELRYGANNSLGISHIQEWTRNVLSGAPLALPALFRRMWLPVDPESHSTYAAQGSPAEPELPRRELLRACVGRYERFVSSTVLSPASTTAHAVSAILQYEELDDLFARYPKLEKRLLARGLAVAVNSALHSNLLSAGELGAVSGTSGMDHAHDVLLQAFSQYSTDDGGTQVSPVFDVVACRHSIATVTRVLSQNDPHQACEVFEFLSPLITTSGVSGPRCRAMGSCVASAVVSASLRAKKVALRDPTASTKRVKSAKDRFRRALHRPTLKFDTLLSVAQQLQGKKRPISPQLYQDLGSAAMALDLGRWLRRKSWPGAQMPRVPQRRAGRPDRGATHRPSDSPVQFLARDSKRKLKTLRDSQPYGANKQRQLIGSQQACQALSLTQNAGDVRSLVFNLLHIDSDYWNTAKWVRVASDDVVCAVVHRLVQHSAWDTALQVVNATLATSEVAEDIPKVEFPEQHAVLKRPHQMLELLLASSGNERAGMSGRHHRVLNVMLQAALVNLSQSHSQQAPAHATRPIVTALGLLQKHRLPLYKHTAQQLLLASVALRGASTQSIAKLKSDLLTDSAVKLLGWRTAFQALLLAGDDGTAVLDISANMPAEELVGENAHSQSAAVAALYTIMRAPDSSLSDRLLKTRRLLSRLSLAQVETEELPHQLVRAIVAGFFQHARWMQDVCSHGLLEMNSLLLSAGLPFGRHLQLQLAQHKYEAACGLLRLGIPGAEDYVYKCGLERLLIADTVFARAPAGKKCFARLVATDGPESVALTKGGMLDLIPYLSDGYVVSVGHATQPMHVEELFQVAQSMVSQPQRRKHDLTTFLDVDSVNEDIQQVAPLLRNCKAGRVHAPDWLQVQSEHCQESKFEGSVWDSGWQPAHFSQLGLFPDSFQHGAHEFGDALHLVHAIEQLLIVQRMIQAVPPE